ncbi:NUMOD4 motif-containing HNH endonuclease [Bacillus tropicus]|uniref:NUMOD4 motif-containing HNH endonuclease n=1 Tax=Bacillus tropicus TaxID=2026188 RepID=UPI001D0EFC3A|nr:NUMOD4 motif-containing HNH endonuclease [Bacillus tropicus]MCC2341873.1 NUMOD4 motif-containing HNH endonuclease [Bacillus tropicus]
MNERWKEVVGFEGYYVSDLGNVKGKQGTLLKQQLNKSTGYYHVNVRKNGKPRTNTIHRLVAEAFLPMVEGKTQVNHIDGDKTNNNVNNLEWVTASENRKHAYDNGLIKNIKERSIKAGIGSRNNLGKKVVLTHKDGRSFTFDSIRHAAEEMNLDRRTLQRVAKKQKSYNSIKGYTVDYV